MTDMMVRPLSDNRMLRATGGQDLTVSLGASMGAVFDTPMWTGLLGQKVEQQRAQFGVPTAEDRARSNMDEFNQRQEISNLEDELSTSLDSVRRDEITTQLDTLSQPYQDVLTPEARASMDATETQTPEALAEMYGDLGLTFDRAMSTEEAQLLADNKKAELIRQAIISKGPSGVLPSVAMFGAGLAAMATDPLEVASMFIPVVGTAGKAAAIARFGRVGGRVAVGATEGLVGSALTEPFYFTLSRQQQLDYTMSDALLNIGLGTIFGGGIGAIGGVLARADVPIPTKVDGEPVRVEMPDVAKGVSARADVPTPARVSITPIDREAAGTALRQFVNDQSVGVTAKPRVLVVDDAPTIKFADEFDVDLELFHGTSEVFTEFDIEKSQGGGIWLTTDRAAIERGDVGAGTQGNIINARLKKDMKFADWDAYDKFSTDELINQGYDGLRLDEGEGSYTYAIFDDKNISIVDETGAPKRTESVDAPSNVKVDTASQLAKNAEISRMADPQAAKAYDEYVRQDFTGDTTLTEDIKMYNDMVDQIEVTPEQKVMLDEVAEMEAKAKSYADVSRVAATCMART